MRKFFALLSALSLLIVSLSGCNLISEANPATDFEYGFSEIYDGIFIKEYIGSDKTVVIPSKIDGQAVTVIAGGAFVGTSIESLVIPDSVKFVVARAFYGCDQLKTVDFGDGIIEIQEEAFRECTALESIILPKNLETIGEGAFYGCTSATEIYIPKTLTNWKNGGYRYPTFFDCTALETLTIEDGLSVLGGYSSFSCASSLKNLVIPASVEKIGDVAFHSATALESVTFLGDAPQVTENVFGYPNTETASPNLVIYYDPNTSGWDDTVLSQYHLVSIYDKTE
jgi:hypothetical protein